MNRLLLKNTHFLTQKPNSKFKNNINFYFSSNKFIKTSQKCQQHSTNTKTNQNNFKLNPIHQDNSLHDIKSQSHLFNIKYLKNLINQSTFKPFNIKTVKTKQSSKFLNHQQVKFQSTDNTLLQVQQSSSNNFSMLKWLRRLILVAFVAKLLQKGGIHCQYDINGMIITYELQERLLAQEQDNEREYGQQKEKKKKRKFGESNRNSIKKTGFEKDQRYGTVQQMIKHQMQNSDDFDSVEQRIIIREIQQKRDQNKQNQSKKQNKKQKKNQVKQNIANHIFNSQGFKKQNKQQKTQQKSQQKVQFDYSKKPAILHQDNQQDDDKPPMTKSQQKIQNDKTMNQYQKTLKFIADFDDDMDQLSQEFKQLEQQNKQKSKQKKSSLDSWFYMEKLKTQIPNTQNNITQVQKPQTFQDIKIQDIQQGNNSITEIQSASDALPKQIKQIQETRKPFINAQNSAVIYLNQPSFQPLAKRIQNFLKLRGITVNIQSQPNQSNQPTNNLKLHLCNKISECKDINFKPESQQNRDVFHHINNFIHPPHIINSIDQAKSLLQLIQNDESIVSSFIPESIEGNNNHPQNKFDTFSSKYPQVDPKKAQKQFNEYKYLSSTKKNCFVIIRDKQVANFLKIPTNKIGTPHILHKYDKELNGKQSEPNCKIDGEFYHSIGNIDKIIQKQNLDSVEKVAHKLNILTQKGFTHTNVIQDLHDKIRQLKQQTNGFLFTGQQKSTGSLQKKLFVIKTNDPQSQTQINTILQKLSKLNKNDLSIIKTQSQALLKSLRIFVNDEYGTIRLFDLDHHQQPIIKIQGDQQQQKQYISRYLPNVPFQVQALSKWISNLTKFDKPHIQHDRSVNKLKASHPHDFKPTQNGNTKLVLFYKDGCKGCKLMQDLLSHLVQLKQKLQSGQAQGAKRIKRQICLKYRIEDPQHLSRLQITKFNILNEDETIQVPQSTPTLYIFNSTNTQKVTLKTDDIFNHLNKITTGNSEVIQDYMMRDLIEQIEKNVRKMQSMV